VFQGLTPAVLVGALFLCGCSSGSGDTTVAPAPATEAATAAPAATMKINAPWTEGAPIDPKYTCDGRGGAPDVTWTGVPPETKEVALIFHDSSAGYMHWAPIALPPTLTGIVNLQVPDGTRFLKNGDGFEVYLGLCPGQGKTHTYVMSLYALAAPFPDYDKYVFPEQLRGALEKDSLAVATVSGTYTGK
jgi:Raf kinase inhibitor-like YbhB/YbcL family protein